MLVLTKSISTPGEYSCFAVGRLISDSQFGVSKNGKRFWKGNIAVEQKKSGTILNVIAFEPICNQLIAFTKGTYIYVAGVMTSRESNGITYRNVVAELIGLQMDYAQAFSGHAETNEVPEKKEESEYVQVDANEEESPF